LRNFKSNKELWNKTKDQVKKMTESMIK
jgi:DNA polymerase kappa